MSSSEISTIKQSIFYFFTVKWIVLLFHSVILNNLRFWSQFSLRNKYSTWKLKNTFKNEGNFFQLQNTCHKNSKVLKNIMKKVQIIHNPNKTLSIKTQLCASIIIAIHIPGSCPGLTETRTQLGLEDASKAWESVWFQNSCENAECCDTYLWF